MRGRFYAVLITLFILPFLIGGIFGGFYLVEALHRSGVLGVIGGNVWLVLLIHLFSVVLGIYLGGLIGYVVFLAGATTLFSRKAIELFASNLPQSTRNRENVLRAPFTAVSNFFWARAR